ncbi:hypothetical protein [Prescottella equi]
MTEHCKTEAEARAALAALEPIIEIEGRCISEHDRALILDLPQGIRTLDEVRDILLREAGYL